MGAEMDFLIFAVRARGDATLIGVETDCRHFLPPSVETMRDDVDEEIWTMAAPKLGDAKVTS